MLCTPQSTRPNFLIVLPRLGKRGVIMVALSGSTFPPARGCPPPRVRCSSAPIHSAVLLVKRCATMRCTHTPAVRTEDNRVAHTGHNLCLTVTIPMRRAITYESVCWTWDAGLWPPRFFHAAPLIFPHVQRKPRCELDSNTEQRRGVQRSILQKLLAVSSLPTPSKHLFQLCEMQQFPIPTD